MAHALWNGLLREGIHPKAAGLRLSGNPCFISGSQVQNLSPGRRAASPCRPSQRASRGRGVDGDPGGWFYGLRQHGFRPGCPLPAQSPELRLTWPFPRPRRPGGTQVDTGLPRAGGHAGRSTLTGMARDRRESPPREPGTVGGRRPGLSQVRRSPSTPIHPYSWKPRPLAIPPSLGRHSPQSSGLLVSVT